MHSKRGEQLDKSRKSVWKLKLQGISRGLDSDSLNGLILLTLLIA